MEERTRNQSNDCHRDRGAAFKQNASNIVSGNNSFVQLSPMKNALNASPMKLHHRRLNSDAISRSFIGSKEFPSPRDGSLKNSFYAGETKDSSTGGPTYTISI